MGGNCIGRCCLFNLTVLHGRHCIKICVVSDDRHKTIACAFSSENENEFKIISTINIFFTKQLRCGLAYDTTHAGISGGRGGENHTDVISSCSI